MPSDGYLMVSCLKGLSFVKDRRHKLMVTFGDATQKSHYIRGDTDFDFDSCFVFDSSLEAFQNNKITVYVMSDEGFSHKPKKVASYEVSGMPRDGAKAWGPVTVICTSLSNKEEYCRLVLQIQYVSFEDIFVNPPSFTYTKSPALLSLRFFSANLAKEGWAAKGLTIEMYEKYTRVFRSPVIHDTDLNVRALVPVSRFEKDNEVAVVLYYDRDKFAGEIITDLSDLLCDNETNFEFTLQGSGCKESVLHVSAMAIYSESTIVPDSDYIADETAAETLDASQAEESIPSSPEPQIPETTAESSFSPISSVFPQQVVSPAVAATAKNVTTVDAPPEPASLQASVFPSQFASFPVEMPTEVSAVSAVSVAPQEEVVPVMVVDLAPPFPTEAPPAIPVVPSVPEPSIPVIPAVPEPSIPVVPAVPEPAVPVVPAVPKPSVPMAAPVPAVPAFTPSVPIPSAPSPSAPSPAPEHTASLPRAQPAGGASYRRPADPAAWNTSRSRTSLGGALPGRQPVGAAAPILTLRTSGARHSGDIRHSFNKTPRDTPQGHPMPPPISEPVPQSFAQAEPATPISEPVPLSFAQGHPMPPPISEPVPQSFAQAELAAPISEPVPLSFAQALPATPIPKCMVIDDADLSLTYEMNDDESYAPVAVAMPNPPAPAKQSILSPDVMISNDLSSSHVLSRLEKTNIGILDEVQNLPSVPSSLPSVINHDIVQCED